MQFKQYILYVGNSLQANAHALLFRTQNWQDLGLNYDFPTQLEVVRVHGKNGKQC